MDKEEEYHLKRRVSRDLINNEFKNLLKIVEDTIIEKRFSSTQTYWKEYKKELIKQSIDQNKTL